MNQPTNSVPALPDNQNAFIEAIDERTDLSNAYLELIYNGTEAADTKQQNAIMYVAQHMADLTSFARHADLVIKGFVATLAESDARIAELVAERDDARADAEDAYQDGFYAGEESGIENYWQDENSADTDEAFSEGFERGQTASEADRKLLEEKNADLEAELETERAVRAQIADELAAYQDWYQQYSQGKTA